MTVLTRGMQNRKLAGGPLLSRGRMGDELIQKLRSQQADDISVAALQEEIEEVRRSIEAAGGGKKRERLVKALKVVARRQDKGRMLMGEPLSRNNKRKIRQKELERQEQHKKQEQDKKQNESKNSKKVKARERLAAELLKRLRTRQPDETSLAALEEEIETTKQSLEVQDGTKYLSKKQRARKRRTRLLRALKVVKALPQFRTPDPKADVRRKGSQSNDPSTEQQSQARLQLQRRYYQLQKAQHSWKERLQSHVRRGEMREAENAEAEMKYYNRAANQVHKQLHAKRIPSEQAIQMSREWIAESSTLDEFLQDLGLTKQDHPHSDVQTHQGETSRSQHGQQPLEDRQSSSTVRDSITRELSCTTQGSIGPKQEPGSAEAELEKAVLQLQQTHSITWEHHKAAMIRQFEAAGMIEPVWRTKLAVQERGYQIQAENETQVMQAQLSTDCQVSHGPPSHMIEHEGTASDADLPTNGLWELSSTMLWGYYEGGHSWKQVGWVPGGYLRIQTHFANPDATTGVASIILDLGDRTFGVVNAQLPRMAPAQPFELTATCHQGGDDAQLGFRFLLGGHVRLSFPALPLIRADPGCCILPVVDKVVEFAGVFMGKAD